MAGARPYVAANFFLDIEGIDCGICKKVSGGNATAEVTELAQNGNYFVKKHLNSLKWKEFKLEMAGIDVGPLNDRIEALLNANHGYFDGAISACDFNLQAKSVREFKQALLTSVTYPACDASKAKEPAYIQVEFMPENAKTVKGSGARPQGKTNVAQKMLMPANFHCVVDAISGTTDRVKSVSAPNAKVGALADEVGFRRIHDLIPSKGVQFSNIDLVMPAVDADKAFEWHQKFCIDGYCTEQDETTAEITYYSANLKEELITVKFQNVGIFGCETDEHVDQSDKALNVKLSMYCERFKVEVKKKG